MTQKQLDDCLDVPFFFSATAGEGIGSDSRKERKRDTFSKNSMPATLSILL
jgi:hypothetical protein